MESSVCRIVKELLQILQNKKRKPQKTVHSVGSKLHKMAKNLSACSRVDISLVRLKMAIFQKHCDLRDIGFSMAYPKRTTRVTMGPTKPTK